MNIYGHKLKVKTAIKKRNLFGKELGKIKNRMLTEKRKFMKKDLLHKEKTLKIRTSMWEAIRRWHIGKIKAIKNG